MKKFDQILRIIGAIILPAYIPMLGVLMSMGQEGRGWFFQLFFFLSIFNLLATLSNIFLSSAINFLPGPKIASHIIIRIPSYSAVFLTVAGLIPPLNMLLIGWGILLFVCLPTMIAFRRNHPWKGFVMVISILGALYYLIFWVIGLIWSFISKPSPRGKATDTASV